MIKLTERLQAVADMVKSGSTVVDVGCDHGYIPAYLVENKICDNVFACDINEAPLNSCRLLVSQTIYENKITACSNFIRQCFYCQRVGESVFEQHKQQP